MALAEARRLRQVARGDLTPDNPIDNPTHFIYQIDRPDADPKFD